MAGMLRVFWDRSFLYRERILLDLQALEDELEATMERRRDLVPDDP